jgi:hypothetical protein
VEVDLFPTNNPPIAEVPILSALPAWYIAANQTSSLSFFVSDQLVYPDELTVTANSSNPGLIPNSGITVSSAGGTRLLTVTPNAGQSGASTIALTVNEPPGGLNSVSNLLISVMFATNVVAPNIGLLDTNLYGLIATTLGVTNLTTVDLMYLTTLAGFGADITSLSGLQYASNLAALYLGDNKISNLASLQYMSRLTALDLDYNPLINLSVLQTLTNLTSLVLSGTATTNIDVVQSLPSLTFADLSMNLLDLNPNSPALALVSNLLARGVNVHYLPQFLNGAFFNSPGFDWQSDGNAGWYAQSTVTQGGNPAARSGVISDNQMATLETTVLGPGVLTFWWKVSSESGYDWLQFWVADYTNRISGEVDWQQQTVNVPVGTQTLHWWYVKDPATSMGLDAAWLSGVTFAPRSWLEITAGPANGHCTLLLHPVPGEYHQVLSSTNLLDWVLLDMIAPTNGTVQVVYSNATSRARYYRLLEVTLNSIWFETPSLGETNIQLVLHSPPGLKFQLQFSQDMLHWNGLGLITNTLGTYQQILPTNAASSLYRAMLVP